MKKLREYRNAWEAETEEEAGALVNGAGFCFVMGHEDNKVHKRPEIVSVRPVGCARPVVGKGLWLIGFFDMYKEVLSFVNFYSEGLTGQEVYCTTELLEKVTKKGGEND